MRFQDAGEETAAHWEPFGLATIVRREENELAEIEDAVQVGLRFHDSDALRSLLADQLLSGEGSTTAAEGESKYALVSAGGGFFNCAPVRRLAGA